MPLGGTVTPGSDPMRKAIVAQTQVLSIALELVLNFRCCLLAPPL